MGNFLSTSKSLPGNGDTHTHTRTHTPVSLRLLDGEPLLGTDFGTFKMVLSHSDLAKQGSLKRTQVIGP